MLMFFFVVFMLVGFIDLFFFFQAEDGIRDKLVTGVQTCALPISLGRPILEFYHAMDRYDALKAGFDQWGTWIIILKGMTPIPYKLITIASGVAHFDLWAFIGASIISRSLRFFLVAVLLWWFGDAARRFIEKRLTLATSLFAVGLVGGFVVLRYL